MAKIKEARAAAAKEGADFEAELAAIGKEWEGVITAAAARDPALEPLLRDYAPLQGRYLRGMEDSLRLKLTRWMENEKHEGHTRRSGQARALRQHAMAKAAVELLRGGSALINEYSRTDTGPVLRELAAAPGYLEHPSSPEEWRDWNDPMLSGAIPREVLRALAERPEETLAALHAAIGPPVDEMAWPLLEDYEAASVQPTLGQFILSSALQTRLTPEELAVKARFDASMTRWRERADRVNQ